MENIQERRKALNPSALPRHQVHAGSCFAEVVVDRRANPRIYHVIIQREGSQDILAWAQYRDREEAERAAKAYVQECAATEANRNTAA